MLDRMDMALENKTGHKKQLLAALTDGIISKHREATGYSDGGLISEGWPVPHSY